MQNIFKVLKYFIRSPRGKLDVVRWMFTVKKVSFSTYQICFRAHIDAPWRIYSQQSCELGPLSIRIKFEDNPCLVCVGNLKEKGNLKSHFDKAFNTNTHFYTTTVDLIQNVKAFVQPECVRGRIIYMVCTDQQLGNPREIEFGIVLE